MIVISMLMVASQGNMLNPTNIPVTTLIMITTISSAVIGGGYLVTLASHVHE